MPESVDTAAALIAQRLMQARQDHQHGRLDRARSAYQAILNDIPDQPDAMYLLGLVLYRQSPEQAERAIELIEHAICCDPKHAMAHASLAQIFQDQAEHQQALNYFELARRLSPGAADILNGLGRSLFKLGRLDAARAAFSAAIERHPGLLIAHLNLGNLMQQQGEFADAERCYRHCLSLAPDSAAAHNHLGVLYQLQQRPDLAAQHFLAAIRLRPDDARACNNLGAILLQQKRLSQSLQQFERACNLDPDLTEARLNTGMALQQLGRHAQAKVFLDRALTKMPENLALLWLRCVAELLPVYATERALESARVAYQRQLEGICTRQALAGIVQRRELGRVAALMPPYLLPYQAQNDAGLQAQYGGLLRDLQVPKLCSNLNSLSDSQAPAPASHLKVGLVSAFFYDHSNWKIPLVGWLRALANRYEVFAYYTGSRDDRATQVARSLARVFHRGMTAAQFREQIIADELDILIYPEIGMNPVTIELAVQRLAPVQCVSWGHPVSSGLPEIDYFLSSDLMEPRNADVNYTEQLIRLPGLSFSWSTPQHDLQSAPERTDFGLDAQDVVYLCVQNLSKYLPQYDAMLVEIVRRLPASKLVFISAATAVTAALSARLRAGFEQLGLDFERHVRFLPRLNRGQYHALNCVADVFLDSFEWSGCNSTLEALQCDLPVVTLPGRWMRGRHSAAIYRAMEYYELIARDEQHYIELAVRLGDDPGWRERQVRHIAMNKHRVIDDPAPSEALADCLPGLCTGTMR